MVLFEDIFAMHSLVMVLFSSMVIIVCLVVLVGKFWLIGLLMLSMNFWQILFICAMGSAFETSCREFTEKMYSIDWHLLSPRHRTFLRIMLQLAQKPRLNTMGGFLPSNLNTFMMVRSEDIYDFYYQNSHSLFQVLRQMYSILMMLLRFVH